MLVPLASNLHNFILEILEFFFIKKKLFFSAYLLILTEAYGERIKVVFKRYYWVTLIIYESIGVLTIFVCIHALWPTERSMDAWYSLWHGYRGEIDVYLRDVLFSVAISIYFLTIGLMICLFWLKNTFVHLSLYRCNMLNVSKRSRIRRRKKTTYRLTN